MPNVLVVANETVGGRSLLESVRRRAEESGARFHLVVPRRRPRFGNVIYDEAARQAAQVRIDLATDFLRREGIAASGEVGDEDPFTATLDAVEDVRPDEIIVSTHPETRSGWLRRDLPGRIAEATGLPVEHVVTDVEQEGLAFKVTLVIANRTAASDELVGKLREQAEADKNRIFVCVIPQEGGEGRHTLSARRRLDALLGRLRSGGLLAAGMVGDPDPYTAAMNALDLFTVDEIVISTLPGTRSGWLRGDLIERVKGSTAAHVEHVVSETEGAAV
jgi:hypothetical protein